MTTPPLHRPRPARGSRGMTVLEIMIVLAIIGGGAVLVRSGFRMISKADLVENATELTAILQRTSQLAIEHGEMHRVVFDFEKQAYGVEVCQGQTAIVRNEAVTRDQEEVKRALDRARQRMAQLPPDALAGGGDPDAAMARTAAIAGHHVADRQCIPAQDTISGDATGKGWVRMLSAQKGIKLREIWVQHVDEGTTKGQVAIYFFPVGSAEKAVVELTDGSDVFTVLVHGLTGRVELKDGQLRSVDDHMLRNALGDKDAQRDGDEVLRR